MTIVEELDKKSGRPHRSKNIVDAMKYAYGLDKTPQNIAEAVKNSEGSGGGSIETANLTIVNNTESTQNFKSVSYGRNYIVPDVYVVSAGSTELVGVCVPSVTFYDGNANVSIAGDIEFQDGAYCISGDGTLTLSEIEQN